MTQCEKLSDMGLLFIFQAVRLIGKTRNRFMVTASWQPYVKNVGPNITFDYGSRAAALWLDR